MANWGHLTYLTYLPPSSPGGWWVLAAPLGLNLMADPHGCLCLVYMYMYVRREQILIKSKLLQKDIPVYEGPINVLLFMIYLLFDCDSNLTPQKKKNVNSFVWFWLCCIFKFPTSFDFKFCRFMVVTVRTAHTVMLIPHILSIFSRPKVEAIAPYFTVTPSCWDTTTQAW